MSKAKTKKSTDIKKLCANCYELENLENPQSSKLKACSRCKIVFYCSRPCQAAHWKLHKPLCIPVSDRIPKNIPLSDNKASAASYDDDDNDSNEKINENKCVICLEYIKKNIGCTLPCSHMFHSDCIKMLRSYSESQSCPLCRVDLPPGPEKAFTKALRLLHSITNTIRISYLNFTVNEKNIMKEVFQLLICSGEEGYIPSQIHLSSIYFTDSYIKKDNQLSYEWMLKAAKLGDCRSQLNIGAMYYNGTCVRQSYIKACEWYMKAADQGDTEAQGRIGDIYQNNYPGINKDMGKIKKWLEIRKKLADTGDLKAIHEMGRHYENGIGVKKNMKIAEEYWLKAAKLGYSSSQLSLALMFYAGPMFGNLDIKKDYSKAFYWFTLAANQGEQAAQHNLGIMYNNGYGVDRDLYKSSYWFHQAANQGHAMAQHNLGLCYLYGQGVEKQSSKIAKEYFMKSAAQGYDRAIAQLKLF